MEINNETIKQIKITPLINTLRLEDISDNEYFSERFKGYISNSRLGLLITKGVQAFFDGVHEDNPSFALGTILHQLVLQPESFELIDSVFKPTAKAGKVADYLYEHNGVTPTDDDIKIASIQCNYYKDKLTTNRLNEFKLKAEPYLRDRFLFEENNPSGNKERIYTDEKTVNIVKECLTSINKTNAFKNLLQPEGVVERIYSANERAILLDILAEIEGYEPKTFRLKAKLDNFTIDQEADIITINDLKTTSRPIDVFDPTYYHYQREIASYSWLLKMCAKKFFNIDNPEIKGNFLAVSTVPEYGTCIYPMTKKLFNSGWKEYIYLLKTAIWYNIVEGYEFS